MCIRDRDKIDGKILDILQGNARASLKEIAEQVFLSPTAVGARIDRMLQELSLIHI